MFAAAVQSFEVWSGNKDQEKESSGSSCSSDRLSVHQHSAVVQTAASMGSIHGRVGLAVVIENAVNRWCAKDSCDKYNRSKQTPLQAA